jgi:hypothetical protein
MAINFQIDETLIKEALAVGNQWRISVGWALHQNLNIFARN